MPDLPTAALALAALAAAGGSPSEPIRLTASQGEGQTIFRVVGESPVAVTARYELEIMGGSGNRTRNVGDATVQPGRAHEYATVRMSGDRYVARLTVTTPQGRYERVLRSPKA